MDMLITMKAARVNSHMTQTDIAKLLGVTPPTYSRWEQGNRHIPAYKFMEFCKVVNIEPKFIILP